MVDDLCAHRTHQEPAPRAEPAGADDQHLMAGVAGELLYLMMYASVMVPENNPVFDDHLLGAISVVVLALTLSGDTWGLGKLWARMPFVRGNGVLR